MSVRKRVLCAQRLRQVHRPFGWVDVRLIRDGWLRECSPTAWALYLFWVTVADAQGLSCYADRSVARHLCLEPELVAQGRQELIRADLLAYEFPFVQVLALAERRPPPITAEPARGPDDIAVLVNHVKHAWNTRGAIC